MGIAEQHKLWRRQHFITFSDQPIVPTTTTTTDTPSFTLLDPTFVSQTTTSTSTTDIGGCLGCTATTTSTSTTSTTSLATTSSSSSTTTSSSSSTTLSTTSSTPSSTSTSTTAPPTTSAPTSSTNVVQYSTATDTVYHSISASSTVSHVASSTATTKSASSSSGLMIGGISAGVICALGLLIAAVYMIRRCKNSRTDDEFDPDAFRRQSVMVPEGPPPPRPWESMDSTNGQKVRPPTMIERRMVNNTSPVYGQYGQQRGYGQPPSPGPFAAYAPQPPMRSFTPGQIVSPPPSATTGMPFFAAQAYDDQAQMLPSPTVSAVGHYDSAYDEHGNLVRKPSAAYAPASPAPTLARQPSRGAPAQAPAAAVVAPPVPGAQDLHYVDLDRSSVTPFQAAQYAELSRKLSEPIKAGASKAAASQLRVINETPLPSPTLPEAKTESALAESENGHDPVLAAASPFEDPVSQSVVQPVAEPAVVEPKEEVIHEELEEVDVGALEAPTPAFIEYQRIASMPPVLPERPFSSITMSDFPMPAASTSAPAAVSTMARTAPTPAPAAGPAMPAAGPSMPVAAPAPVQMKRPDTVYTMYDPEDAYGGI